MATDQQLTRNHWAFLFGVLLLALLPGFFTIPTMDRDEARYSQAATQMMETGDFVDIRFQEQPRHVKPAGIYWMQVVTASPFGGPDAPIWAFRLPSLFGILLAAAATAYLGSRIADRRTGVIAGVLLGLTLAAAVEARTAKTDAALLASAAVAQVALYLLLVKNEEIRPKFIGLPLVFWAATGVALMIKGPIVTMVSATTIIGYGLWMKDKSVISRIRLLPGLAVMIGIAAPWLIAINIQTNGGFFMESVGHALLGKVAKSDDSHAGPFGYHTLLLPVTFWPGTLLLGVGGALAWIRRNDPTIRFLIVWILPTWIIFEFVATKLPHYILPTFPAIALLAAMGLKEAPALLKEKGPRRAHIALTVLFVIVTLLIALVPMIGAQSLNATMVTYSHIIALVLGIAVAGLGVWASMNLETRRLKATLIASLGVMAVIFGVAIPNIDQLWPSNRTAQVVSTLEGCEKIVAATAGYREPSNVFYLGTETKLTDGEGAAQFLMENAECGVAVVDRRDLAAFQAVVIGENFATRKVGEVTGTNTVKGREMTLSILIGENSKLQSRQSSDGRLRQ